MGKISKDVLIRESKPGDVGYVGYMHGKYYCTKYDFFADSEYYFLKHIVDFARTPEDGKLWIAEVDGNIAGSVAILRHDDKTAQFRFLLVDENYQNMGIGSQLIKVSLDFCRERGYEEVFLWTIKELDKARHLYDKVGFVLTEEIPNKDWGSVEIIDQKMELKL